MSKTISKTTQLISALVLLLLSTSIIAAEAENSYELNNKANQLDSHAANKEAASNLEQSESSLAVNEGKKDKAAKHARRAAKEQNEANKLEDKSNKVEKHAAEKAVKESY